MPKIDLTGKQYEFFKVLKRNSEKKGKNVWWDCECECGKIFTATTTDINKQIQKSCGCKKSLLNSRAHLQDLTGSIFGELVVIERDFNHPQNGQKTRTYWLCQCSCGKKVSIERTHLVNRNQSSCGCKNSIGELNISKILINNNINFKSQYTCSELKTEKNGYLRFDFAILNDSNEVIRLIEFDGPQHVQENNFFKDLNVKLRDSQKNDFAKSNNIPLVRIPYYKRDSVKIEDLMGEDFII